MTKDAFPFPAQTSGRRGLWVALVEADAARSSAVVNQEAEGRSHEVIDLASHAQAHLGYLERLAAGKGDSSVIDVNGSVELIMLEPDVVIDMAEHRSRRSLIA